MFERLHRGWQLPAPAGEAPTSWVVFQGRGYRVGAIRIPSDHPRWRRESEIPGWPVLLFARSPIRIAPVHGDAGIVDPGCGMFLGSDEQYRREAVAGGDERTDWFSFSSELLTRMAPDLDPSELFEPGKPLRFPIEADEFALQRRAFRDALQGSPPDELLIEETLCTLLAAFARAKGRRGYPRAGHGKLAEDVKVMVADRFAEAIHLVDLSEALRVTPPHLCRVFKEVTGGTIHGYRERLRLAAALDRLEDPACDLTDLALELGYSSHAHFATNFRRAFGMSPSSARGTAARVRGRGTPPGSRLVDGGARAASRRGTCRP